MTAAAVLAGFALAHAGMAALAAPMARHRAAFGARLAPATARLLGTALLVLAWLACAQEFGAAVGSAAWCGLLGVGALALALVLAYRPAMAVRGALGAAAIGVAVLGYLYLVRTV